MAIGKGASILAAVFGAQLVGAQKSLAQWSPAFSARELNKQVPDDHETQLPETCDWPHCLPKCTACPATKIKPCWGSYIDSAETCSKYVNNSGCFLGGCLCNPGYCAHEVAAGKYECRLKECTGQGPIPPVFEHTVWMKRFLHFTTGDPFPVPEEDSPTDWAAYIGSIVILPVLLVTLGLVAACATAFFLCCGYTGHHFINGRTKKVQPDDSDGDDESGARVVSASRQQGPKKPGHSCLSLLAVIIIGFSLYAIVSKHHSDDQMQKDAAQILGKMLDDTDQISAQAVDINRTVTKLLANVGTLVKDCGEENPSLRKIVGKFAEVLTDDLIYYKSMVNNYTGMVEDIPTKVLAAREFVVDHEFELTVLPLIPLVFLATVCLFVLFHALSAVLTGTDFVCRCCDSGIGLRLSAVVFVIIIVSVAAVTGVSSTMGVGFSSFCMDPEYNTMAYVEHASNNSEKMTDIVEFYLSGHGANPVIKMSQMARKYIEGIDNTYKSLYPEFKFGESVCDALKGVNVTVMTIAATEVLIHAETLLKGKSIWPYYKDLVRTGICTDAVNGLGKTTLFQCILGLILFPITAIMAHKFLVDWSDYEDSVKDCDEEDDEGVDGDALLNES